MENKFKQGQYIIYRNGERYEIGKIKRVTEDGAFVYYSEGDTAAKTPFECMHRLVNEYVIRETSLGGEDGTNLAEVCADAISRKALINKLEQWQKQDGYDNGEWNLLVDVIAEIKNMPLATDIYVGTKIEPLTDKEQRIFLAAMGRERKVCKEVDDQYTHEPYEVLLTKVCSEIERKVKKALWS